MKLPILALAVLGLLVVSAFGFSYVNLGNPIVNYVVFGGISIGAFMVLVKKGD